jgi:rubredoxin
LPDRPTAEIIIDYLRDAEASAPGTRHAGDPPESTSPTSPVRSSEQAAATRYRCSVCGYVYDERKEGRKWSELPADWVCPVCGAAKSSFQPLDPEVA